MGGRFDNVSPSTLLKYCDALGIVPPPAGKPKADGGVDRLRASVKVLRAASGG